MSNNPSPEPADHEPQVETAKLSRSAVVVLSILLFTAFVMMLNETALAVALPAMMADFNIPAATAQWLLTGFMLTLAVVMPTTGWMLDRFNTRSVYIVAMIAFLVGTISAAMAPSFAILLAARVAQAIGTAIVLPLMLAVAMTLVPPERRGTIMGLISVVMAVGPAIGPGLSGLILGFTTWHGIFWLMVPLGALAGILAAITFTNVTEQQTTPLDALSVVLSAIAFGGLVYGLSSVGTIINGGTTLPAAFVIFAIGVLGLGLFVWRQLVLGKHERALLNLRPLAVPNFTIALIVVMVLTAVLLGAVNTLPIYLQEALLVSALISGLVILPGGLLEGGLSPLVGLLYDRIGPRPLIIPGMTLVTGALFLFATTNEHTQIWLVVAIHIVFSLGLASVITALLATALGSLPSELYSHGSAMLNTLQQVAGAAGIALVMTIYSSVAAAAQAQGAAETAAFAAGGRAAFVTAGCVSLAGLVLSLFIRRVPEHPKP